MDVFIHNKNRSCKSVYDISRVTRTGKNVLVSLQCFPYEDMYMSL